MDPDLTQQLAEHVTEGTSTGLWAVATIVVNGLIATAMAYIALKQRSEEAKSRKLAIEQNILRQRQMTLYKIQVRNREETKDNIAENKEEIAQLLQDHKEEMKENQNG